MLARTHASVALALSLFLADRYSLSIYFILTAVLFSLLPDLDTPKSFIGRRIWPLSWLIKLIVGHRTLFHAVWLWAITIILVYPLNKAVALGIGVGYITHLLLDSLTRSGVQLFFPLAYRIRGPLKTGRIVEGVLFLSTLMIAVFLAVENFI